jgi:Protein of unknown function (DUF2924)
MTQQIHQEIEALSTQKTKALKARYLELSGEQSRSFNHVHLFRRIAWRLQALSDGDLSQRAQERAADLASDVDLRLRPPRKFWRTLADADAEEHARSPLPDPRLPVAGTTLQSCC